MNKIIKKWIGYVIVLAVFMGICLQETEVRAEYNVEYSGNLVYENDRWYYYEDGQRVPDKQGIVYYNGGEFLVVNGMVVTNSGLVFYNGNWYFLYKGQLQNQYTGLVQYDGEWFYIDEGILDSSCNGILWYNGGEFLVSEGRIRYDYSGLFQEKNGEWYFLSNGQVQNQYSGIAQYDGEGFYITEGMLNKNYIGYVKYDGSVFYVQYGQMVQNEQAMLIYYKAESNKNAYSQDLQEVTRYVNQYRAEVGRKAVVLDDDLCIAACIRAQEMADNDTLSHTRPNGSSCFTIMNEMAIQYSAAGENIAYGYESAAKVSKGWYNSEGHYRNMVNANFGKIGVGEAVNKNGRKYWVQLFTD